MIGEGRVNAPGIYISDVCATDIGDTTLAFVVATKTNSQ